LQSQRKAARGGARCRASSNRFRIADDILPQGVQGITDIITIPGIINRDFAGRQSHYGGHGLRRYGTATAAARALHGSRHKAIASPLLEPEPLTGLVAS